MQLFTMIRGDFDQSVYLHVKEGNDNGRGRSRRQEMAR